jgi:hypothetical protein
MLGMNTEILKDRNWQELEKKLQEFKIEYSVGDLINKFKTIYLSNEINIRRLRLLGVLEIDSNTQKKIQLFVLKRSEYDKLMLEDMASFNTLNSSLELIIKLYRELVLIKEIEGLEVSFQSPYYDFLLSEEFLNYRVGGGNPIE